MKVQSRNGVWNYRIGKGKRRKRQVPFSTLPVGYSECSRTFIPEVLSEKTFLKFDGITYAAKVFLNGKLLGEMLPYSEYTFEITDVVCRENDPTRLVSGANCMSDEDTLKYYQLCGFDFYTMHPYSQTIDRAKHSAAVLSDKPLVFTEWGGHFVYNNPKLLAEFMEEMYGMYERNSDEGALAGAFFWCWAEVNDFNRGTPACVDGNLCEGLVNKYRDPALIYETYRKTLQTLGQKEKEAPFWITYCDEIKADEKAVLSQNLLPEGDLTVLREAISKVVGGQRETSMRKRIIEKGPVLAHCGTLCHVPVVIADGVSLEIPVICQDRLAKITVRSLNRGYEVLLYGIGWVGGCI